MHAVRLVLHINYLIIASRQLGFSFVQSQTIKYLDQLSGYPNDVVAAEYRRPTVHEQDGHSYQLHRASIFLTRIPAVLN